ncbi:RICIN domain-containing protein [Kitasatospora aureofaciens]|uniref:RICIN domain-containing protein n=1 Tax=Kitasatospora aureofaciens TaxID=1894 RepID=UPI001C438D8C|nr:RICIN domain-containing protein [Kitasatospora aureofaciens]MBV6696052.1 RICIN domain-containing protein [Kitasatospora aureofaciens]
MKPFNRTLARTTTVAVTSLTLAAAFASPAAAVTFIGRDVPTTVTIAPGQTAPVPWTYQNTGGPGLLPPSGMSAVFTAPGNTTFPSQSTVPTSYSSDGSSWTSNNVGLRNCALSNGNRTLTCEGYGLNGSRSSWPSNGYFRFSPQVTVDATAPDNTTLPRGSGSFRYTDPNNGTYYTIENGTLNVATPPSRPTGTCLDVGNTRNNADNVRIWQCLDHTNQRFVLDGGRVKVADTVGTGQEMCLDADYTGYNGDNVRIWACEYSQAATANQTWLLRQGSFVLQATADGYQEMCLDVGSTRNNGDNVFLYECGADNTNQKFVVDRGYIKVRDTPPT